MFFQKQIIFFSKIFQKMKSKSWLSIEKKYYRTRKKCFLSFLTLFAITTTKRIPSRLKKQTIKKELYVLINTYLGWFSKRLLWQSYG